MAKSNTKNNSLEDSTHYLDTYLSQKVRAFIEKNYYERINFQSSLDHLVHDKTFMNKMNNHIALFADHGVVHVRNVAALILDTLETIHGIHIPSRSPYRFNMMKGYGVITAYFHDIGMIHFSTFGRATHSEFAAQELYTPELDPYLKIIWNDNCGNLPWRITQLCKKGLIKAEPETVLRECLALVPAHSKSAFPIDILNHSPRLREHILTLLQYDLEYLYYKNQIKKLEEKQKKTPSLKKQSLEKEIKKFQRLLASKEKTKFTSKTKTILSRLYGKDLKNAFSWLLSSNPEVLEFVEDLKDTLRTLRCADALRQRGTSFKTSGGYQIFVSQYTGNAIFALTNQKQQMFLLELDTPHAVGEANIQRCEYTKTGHLIISFYTGFFHTEKALHHSAQCVAMIINDILGDVIDSLKFPTHHPYHENREPIQILLENVHDNWRYTQLVSDALKKINPSLKQRIQYKTPLSNIPLLEKQRYLNAKDLAWSNEKKTDFLENIAKKGFKISRIKLSRAFREIRYIELSKGEYLFEVNSPPGFVYIPLSKGLVGVPLGGYTSFEIAPYSLIGNSSVIAGTQRNASVLATQSVSALMIPQDIYLSFWHDTYDENQLKKTLTGLYSLKSSS